MNFAKYVYQNVARRSSTYALSVVIGALFFLRAFDQGVEYWFANRNRGLLFEPSEQEEPSE